MRQDNTTIRVESNGPVATLTFSNAPSGTLTAWGCKQIIASLLPLLEAPDTKVVIFTGTDDCFIRHYDIASIIDAALALREARATAQDFQTSPFASLVDILAHSNKPTIAAINGTCMGGGLEVALACDIRVVAADVSAIGLPETRLDIVPGGGGTQRLARVIGEAAALDMILRGTVVAAQRAFELGIVHEISDNAVGYATSIANVLASRSGDALAQAKRLTRSALSTPLDQGLRDERDSFAELLRTSDAALDAMRQILRTGQKLENFDPEQ